MRSFLPVLVLLALTAGCGGDDSTKASDKPAPTGTTQQTSTDANEGATASASGSPGPAVRAFLDAYRSGDAQKACAYVTDTFTNPRNRELKPPKACKKGGAEDALDQGLTVEDTKIRKDGERAQVLTLNAKRGRLIFSLRQVRGKWRITLVKPRSRLRSGAEAELS